MGEDAVEADEGATDDGELADALAHGDEFADADDAVADDDDADCDDADDVAGAGVDAEGDAVPVR